MNTPAPTWRLVSFNVQYGATDHWQRKREALGTLLRNLRADVLCLQEVSAEGLAWIRHALDDPITEAAGREDGASAGEHVPVLVLRPDWQRVAGGTFWFSLTPDRPSIGWGAAHPRICSWVQLVRPQAPDLTVFNVHLDHRSRPARAESLRMLRKKIAATPREGRVMVCGDLNLRSPARRLAPLLQGERPLYDAAARAGVLTPTWMGWGPLRLGRARIDYVLADEQLPLQHYAVTADAQVGRHLSDHRPVVADFRG